MNPYSTTAYLALDVSTSCTGIAAFDAQGNLLGVDYYKPKISKKEPTSGHFLVMAKGLGEKLAQFAGCPIQQVWIEEPLRGSNNANTVGTLLKFNGVCSLYVWELFGVLPQYLTVYEWRRTICPEHLKPKPGPAGRRGEKSWSLPAGTDPKAYIFTKVARWYPAATWKYNTKGELSPESLDMSDAAGIGTAGLVQAGVVSPTILVTT